MAVGLRIGGTGEMQEGRSSQLGQQEQVKCGIANSYQKNGAASTSAQSTAPGHGVSARRLTAQAERRNEDNRNNHGKMLEGL